MDDEHLEFMSILAFVYLRHGQAESAAVLLDALHGLQPNDRRIAKSLAYACLKGGRYEDCLRQTERLLKTPSTGDAKMIEMIHKRALRKLGKSHELR